MLTDVQLQTIELLAQGLHTVKQVADLNDISVKTLYRWKETEDYKAEWHRREAELKTELARHTHARLVSKGGVAIDNIMQLANQSKSEKIKLDANIFLYEQIFGKATSRIEQTNIDVVETKEVFDLDMLIEQGK